MGEFFKDMVGAIGRDLFVLKEVLCRTMKIDGIRNGHNKEAKSWFSVSLGFLDHIKYLQCNTQART